MKCARSPRPRVTPRRSTAPLRCWRWRPAPIRGPITRAADGRALVGGRIVRLVIATMLNRPSSAAPLHLKIARAWAPDHKHAADLIRRALVLLADHELNASTFTVRCAASTGLNLYDAMIAGLVALKGPKHGGAGVLAAQLVKTLVDGDVAPVIRERVALGERFAGFGHGIYKHGDPRAQALLDALARAGAARNSPRKFRSGSPRRPANSSISTMRWRCWCTRWACRPAMNWCCLRWRVPSAGSRMPANNCAMAG